ncbi:MAG: ATP-binding protein [Chitinispirillales bacterium]|jgi:hypothetical protein|nr:ATP-binding protein [Chitinispirillales bacterium]
MNSKRTPAPLPIGKPLFDNVIESGCYYVDKTLLVKELLDREPGVTLYTRPRRFGKTLAQTMLKCFFEDTAPVGGKDTRALFNGLKIENAGGRYMEHQGRYPVIFLSFKEAKGASFDESYAQLTGDIAGEFRRHHYVFEKIANNEDKALFETLASGKGTRENYPLSLRFLCECLENYHGQKVIILIDEYDTPLVNSCFHGFYDEQVNFIRPLLGDALKDNPHLQFAVLAGCLPISRESIFTGFDNLEIISVLTSQYSGYFGFTQDEMDAMLKHYGLASKAQVVRDWYDGYLFGDTQVYNPWSSILVVSGWLAYINETPKPYWANTSANDIIREFVHAADGETRAEIEILMSGGTISKTIHEYITCGETYRDSKNLWNALLFAGYLKKTGGGRQGEGGKLTLDLSVPNREIRYIYAAKIHERFKNRISEKNLDALFDAILNGNVKIFKTELEALLSESIIHADSAENFYHGFMTGILSRLNGYLIKSNRETGKGRSDLVMYGIDKKTGKAVVFEFRVTPKYHELPAACAEALSEIENSGCAAHWNGEGYSGVMKYGIGFCGKNCEIRNGDVL